MNESKVHILKTAFGLFLQKSYKEVTMKEIVAETGLSKGAFYHYFESKEQLFMEIFDFFFTDMLLGNFDSYCHNSLWEFCEDYLKDIMTKMKRASENGLDMNSNYYFLIFDAIKIMPEFKYKLMESQVKEQAAWSKIINIAREKGEIKTTMTDIQIAKFFVYSNDGVGIKLIIDGNIERLRDELYDLWSAFYKQLKS